MTLALKYASLDKQYKKMLLMRKDLEGLYWMKKELMDVEKSLKSPGWKQVRL